MTLSFLYMLVFIFITGVTYGGHLEDGEQSKLHTQHAWGTLYLGSSVSQTSE